MAKNFRIEHVATKPRGWQVRTVTQGSHQVRIAFPPGKRETGSGHVVEILHPVHENPHSCSSIARRANPAELILMTGINPMPQKNHCGRRHANPSSAGKRYAVKWHTGNISQAGSREQTERLLKRFHGKGELIRVNPMPLRGERYKNPVGAGAEEAIAIREGFVDHDSTGYRVANEPHIPAGDYAELGPLVALAVKPTSSGDTNVVQEIGFKPKPTLIADSSRRQLYFAAGNQSLTERELRTFTSQSSGQVELGTAESIVYLAKKFHAEVGSDVAGKVVEWIHPFGEDTGEKPTLVYDIDLERMSLRGGAYRIEDRGIVN
jgi:hypothetical protein